MRISRIAITNFRNFRSLNIALDAHAVIVGENRIGKSNLLAAIRLVLDPSLPDKARHLREEDFWDGLPRPLKKADKIEVVIELAEFEKNERLLAVLGEHLVAHEPMVARLTYIFQPKPTLKGDPERESDYDFLVYGGDRPDNKVDWDLRRRMPLDTFAALRDAEDDLANWRRSPLRPLLEEAARAMDRKTLEAMANEISKANAKVADASEIKAVADAVSERLTEIVGSAHATQAALGFSPADADKIVKSLRLFIDGGRRGIGDASIGAANLLYLALKSLELDRLVVDESRDHTFLAIEEPEAHLHPHLQRLVYRRFLQPRVGEGGDGTSSRTILLTTHSPHVVSVAPLRSLVVLRKSADGTHTEGCSAAELRLTEPEVGDIERYIDVTRGEMLFAKGVILVEGDAEAFLVPVLGRFIGVDFDQLGISVCSVAGTNFAPYVKLLGPEGICLPFAVLTDGDPMPNGKQLGKTRIRNLLSLLLTEEEMSAAVEEDILDDVAAGAGLFRNASTLELELLRCGRRKSMCGVLAELAPSETARKRAEEWKENGNLLDEEQFLKDIETIGKGRFAQRLSTRIKGSACPEYIKKAIQHVAARCH